MILGHALAVAVNRFDALYKAKRPPLSLTQLIILQAIAYGHATQEVDLPGAVGLEPESIRLILHRIYKRKFFTKEGRGKLKILTLTKTGEAAMHRSAALISRTELEMLEALPASQRQRFKKALSTLIASRGQIPSMIA